MDKIYGIVVARVGGFPICGTERAEDSLSVLDESESAYREVVLAVEKPDFIDDQMNIVNIIPPRSDEESQVLERLRDLSIEEMTPMEAMNSLYYLQKTLKVESDE